MNSIENNIFYILIPFQYEGKVGFERYVSSIESVSGVRLKKNVTNDDFFLGFISETYRKCLSYDIEVIEEKQCIRIFCFESNVGFIVFTKTFNNKSNNTYESMYKDIESLSKRLCEGQDQSLQLFKSNLPFISLFPVGSLKKCLVVSNVITKLSPSETRKLNSDNESIHNIDKLHECYCSSEHILIISNQHYCNICSEEEKALEQDFRNKYNDNILKMFMLLHHERQLYLILRKQIVNAKNENAKVIKKIKERIIDLITCYSYKVITEDTEFQALYDEYRRILNLSDYESTLSDLVFKLDDEIDKGRDKKINFISLIIAVLGLFQLVSVVADILGFISK